MPDQILFITKHEKNMDLNSVLLASSDSMIFNILKEMGYKKTFADNDYINDDKKIEFHICTEFYDYDCVVSIYFGITVNDLMIKFIDFDTDEPEIELSDDAAITLRTVLNFINGYGPTFNIDERVYIHAT